MTLAFLFPGQGGEAPRMGLDLAEGSPVARKLLDRAGRAAGVDLAALLARGGPELGRTEVIQPALVAVSLGAAAELACAGIRPDVVVGHSLGELSAWAAAGCIGDDDAVDLAARRGGLMAREAAAHPGGMLALLDADPPVLEDALVIAGRNAPREWVTAGPVDALRRAAARHRAAWLAAAGPWHSPAMAGAVDELRAAMDALAPSPPRVRIVGASTAAALAGSLVRPFDFAAALTEAGATRFVTVGPGRVLRGLIRKTLGPVDILGTEDRADLARTVEALRA